MVREDIKYYCEICGCCFPTYADAQRCESKGQEDLSEVPLGLIYYHSGFYGELVQAVGGLRTDKHYSIVRCYIARDNGCGDSLDVLECATNWCSPSRTWRQVLVSDNLERNMPALRRLVGALREKGLTPTLLRDGQIVRIEEVWQEFSC